MTLHTSEAPRCMCVTCSNCRKYSFSNTTLQTCCVYDWTTVKTITWQRRTKKQNQQDILLTRHRQILTPPQNWPTPYSIRQSRNEVTYQLLVGWLVDSHFKWPEVINITIEKYYNHWQCSRQRIRYSWPVSNDCARKRIQSTSLLAELDCKNPTIEHIRSHPYHPQSNRQADKFVNIMKRELLKTNGKEERTV